MRDSKRYKSMTGQPSLSHKENQKNKRRRSKIGRREDQAFIEEAELEAAAEAEQAFERLAAFGPGATVIDITTGRTYKT